MYRNQIQDIFNNSYQQFAKHNNLPLYVRDAAYKIMSCRSKELGGHKYLCQSCGEEKIVYNPCHHRSCPSCGHSQNKEWLERQKEKLLDCSHYHMVFTIPHEFNEYWLLNKAVFTNIFFKSVKESLLQLLKNEKICGITPGIISTLQTWGSQLNLHPHIHCLVSDGGITQDGDWKSCSRSVKTGKGYILNVQNLKKVYRAKFMFYLTKELWNNNIQFPKGKLKYEVKKKFRDLKKKEWNVRVEDKYDYGTGVIIYLSNYIKGGPIKNSRIISNYEGIVKFKYKNYKTGNMKSVMNLSEEEFIRRILLHIPEPRTNMVRYYGLYSCRMEEKLNICRKQLGQKMIEKHEEAYESKEVKCSKCKTIMIIIEEMLSERILKRHIKYKEKLRRKNEGKPQIHFERAM